MGFWNSAAAVFRPETREKEAEPQPAVQAPAPLPEPPPPSLANVIRAGAHPKGIGSTGTTVSSGKIRYEEWNTALQGYLLYGRQGREGVADSMRRTCGIVAMSLMVLKLPNLAADWTIQPGEDTRLGREIADFVASNLFEDLPWHSIHRESLNRYDYGFMMFEKLTDYVEVPRERFPLLPSVRTGKGRPKRNEMVTAFRWTGFDPRPPRTLNKWIPNPTRPTMLDGIEQWVQQDDVTQAGVRKIAAQHLLRFTHNQEGGNFEGISVLRPIYSDFRQLDHLERIDAIRHERQNVGIPVIEFDKDAPDPGAEELTAMQEALEHLTAYEQSFIVMAKGGRFHFDTSGSGDGTRVLSSIMEKKRAILDNVLAGYLVDGAGSAAGSYAKAEIQQSHQTDFTELGVKQTEEVFNRGSDGCSPIRELVDANYGRQLIYPKLKAKNVKGRNYIATMKLLATLVQSGALPAGPQIQKFIHQRLDLDEPYVIEDRGDDVRDTLPKPPEGEPVPAPAPDHEEEPEVQPPMMDDDDETPTKEPEE